MNLKTKLRSIKSVLLTGLCLCVLAACKDNSGQKPDSANYKTMEVKLGNTKLESTYTATIKGKQAVEIRPQVSGLIMEICLNEGAEVKKGQTLFIIDQVSYKAALETALANVKSAEAKVATAKLTADSKQELFARNVISDFDLQTARNSLLEAKAVLAQAKAAEVKARNELSYTVVKSPLNGVASMIPYKEGTLVSSSVSVPLVTVSDDAEVYAYFSLTEKQILGLTRSNSTIAGIIDSMLEVGLLLSDGTTYEQMGKIDALSGTVDNQTGSVVIRATFGNPGKILRNGGAASVVIPYNKENCIIIPQSATFEIQNRTYVYKVVDNKTQSVAIETFAINNGKEFIVESGLKAGDIIIAEGAGLMREGVSVTNTKSK